MSTNDKWHGIAKDSKVQTPDGKTGVASYRHTHNIEGEPVGMIGVLIDAPEGEAVQLSGRTVKHISYRADTLTLLETEDEAAVEAAAQAAEADANVTA